MRLLRTTDYQRMPWKNGGGETIEMMVSPAGTSLDSFDWRLSMAHVGGPGPFSLFPNIDRNLSVIAGAGLTLTFGDGKAVLLDRQSQPFGFAGDVAVDSTLIDGPIDDLNVMTRRDRCRHRVSRQALATPTQMTWDSDIAIIVAIGHGIAVSAGPHAFTLGPKDAAILGAGDSKAFAANPQDEADLFLIEIWYS